jgi:hypothetical protein
MANQAYVLIVGDEHLTHPLVSCLEEKGVECLCITDAAKAAALVDVAEQEGAPINVAFLSSDLKQAQLEWLLAYIRGKESFRISRIIVVGAENESKIKYWLQLGATSCVGSQPQDLSIAANYWASLIKSSA